MTIVRLCLERCMWESQCPGFIPFGAAVSSMPALCCACLHTSFWAHLHSNFLPAENGTFWLSLCLTNALWSWSLKKKGTYATACRGRRGHQNWGRAASCNPQRRPLAWLALPLRWVKGRPSPGVWAVSHELVLTSGWSRSRGTEAHRESSPQISP